jgi:hypothetical protein
MGTETGWAVFTVFITHPATGTLRGSLFSSGLSLYYQEGEALYLFLGGFYAGSDVGLGGGQGRGITPKTRSGGILAFRCFGGHGRLPGVDRQDGGSGNPHAARYYAWQ